MKHKIKFLNNKITHRLGLLSSRFTHWLGHTGSRFVHWLRRSYSTFLVIIICLMVGTILLILFSQAATARKGLETNQDLAREIKQLVETTKRNEEEHRLRNEQVHDEIKDFLCDLVRTAPPERITSEALALCANSPPPGGRPGTTKLPPLSPQSDSQPTVPTSPSTEQPQPPPPPPTQPTRPTPANPPNRPITPPPQTSIIPFKEGCTVNLLGVCI